MESGRISGGCESKKQVVIAESLSFVFACISIALSEKDLLPF